MGLFDLLFPETHVEGADGVRILDTPTAMNLRGLGGYDTPDGPTQPNRYIRCGSTRYISERDIKYLLRHGLTNVLDLRGSGESPQFTCAFARRRDVAWKNVSLYDFDLSDPKIVAAQKDSGYLVGGYLSMLGRREAIRQVFSWFATVPKQGCVLFHCAAGMDRTGVTAMLLLGLAGVSRADITRDYLYSYASRAAVDRFVDEGVVPQNMSEGRLATLLDVIGQTYDKLLDMYGGVGAYLLACGVTEPELDALHARLLEP